MPASPKFSTFPTRQYDTPALATPSSSSSLTIASLATFLQSLRPTHSLSSTSLKFVLLCLLWYFSSALSNNSLKQILINFNYPVTLTFVQFGFIAGWCLILALAQQLRGQNHSALFGARSGIRAPSKQILLTTLPMTCFQIAGHIFGSLATSEIPVSVVHTVKALSPLFTVLTYRFMFRVQYSPSTYLSLLPLTLGVMLACSFELSANIIGLIYAMGSTIVFVSQNIFIKRLHFQESSATESLDGHNANGHASVKGMFKAPVERENLDKLNILFYSSGMAFLLMLPVWLWNEGAGMIWRYLTGTASSSNSPLTFLLTFNGTVHFSQNIIAFSLLSVASPVAYSIAGLVKRIFVIVISIIWFGQKTTFVQACGIIMTFIGLYMYDQAKMEVARGERKVQRLEYQEKHLLPLDTSDIKMSAPPTPDPFLANRPPLSATSATENRFPGRPPRRRSSSFSEHSPPPPREYTSPRDYSNWSMGGIQEMTPPITPKGSSSPAPVVAPLTNGVKPENMGRQRYSGSSHAVGVKGMNGVPKGINSPGREFPPESIDEKVSRE